MERVPPPHARAVASFDGLATLIQDGRPIVIDSTQSRGTLYTHELKEDIKLAQFQQQHILPPNVVRGRERPTRS